MNLSNKPIGIFYEHPTWFGPLFAELEQRQIPFVKIPAEAHQYDPLEKEPPFSLFINRMSSICVVTCRVIFMLLIICFI